MIQYIFYTIKIIIFILFRNHNELDFFKTFPSTIFVISLQKVALDVVPRDYGAFIFYTLIFLTHATYTFILANFMPKLCRIHIEPRRSN